MGKPMKTARNAPKSDGALYRVTEKSYINGMIVGPSEGPGKDVVQYDGVPGSKLIPMNPAAEKAKAEAEKAKAQRKLAGPVDPTEKAKLDSERDRLAAEASNLAAERTKLEQERADWAAGQAARDEAAKAAAEKAKK